MMGLDGVRPETEINFAALPGVYNAGAPSSWTIYRENRMIPFQSILVAADFRPRSARFENQMVRKFEAERQGH